MASKRTILVTGGTGYIGSHTVVLLVEAGFDVVIIDNLANSNAAVMSRLAEITGKPEAMKLVELDMRDEVALRTLFAAHKFEAVIHFAGYKAVGESKLDPLLYYSNNMKASINLLEAMRAAGCKRIVFSSSCTVYGGSPAPLTEDSTIGVGITNAYGRTKFQIEEMLRDLHESDPSWDVCILRYFNPVGAHESGRIGEDPRGIPNCLMPYILQVLVGRREKLSVYGNDYATRDGTPIRDYIHVVDVARGHLDALNWMNAKRDESAASASASAAAAGDAAGAAAGAGAGAASSAAHRGVCDVFNFGTGRGSTVLEVVSAMERASGKSVPLAIAPRRAGDLLESYCDPAKAERVLGWKARLDLDRMCVDAWRWQSNNPKGYEA